MLRKPMDLLLVVGGYNSSNTAHLVEIGEPELPTFFIRGASCIKSLEEIVHYDLHHREEKTSDYSRLFSDDAPGHRGHHRRRVVPEQSHRGDAGEGLRAARHQPGDAGGGLKGFLKSVLTGHFRGRIRRIVSYEPPCHSGE